MDMSRWRLPAGRIGLGVHRGIIAQAMSAGHAWQAVPARGVLASVV
jgi:hypothetical protein